MGKKRVRTCGNICHNAKGDKCRCFCGGAYHGPRGLVNREALKTASEQERLDLLAQHGFVHGQMVYREQTKMPIGEENA
jgi:hypothetical protein